MKKIKIINDVCIPIIDEPIGISVSGGADSIILLYFLMKYHKFKIHIFTLADKSKYFRNSKKCIHAIYECATITNNFNFEHHITYTDKQTHGNLFNTMQQYIDSNKIYLGYHGITANPPEEVLEDKNIFSTKTSENIFRNPNVKKEILFGNKRCRPWINIDKKIIHQMYRENNLLDRLFPLTSSCEWFEGLPFDQTVDPYIDHCGHCWWCEERKWGFGCLV